MEEKIWMFGKISEYRTKGLTLQEVEFLENFFADK